MLYQDRTNLGNARVAGLQRDLKMNNHQVTIYPAQIYSYLMCYINQYSVALTVTYV